MRCIYLPHGIRHRGKLFLLPLAGPMHKLPHPAPSLLKEAPRAKIGLACLAWPRARPPFVYTERAACDDAERDEGERTWYLIATSTDHLTTSSANP